MTNHSAASGTPGLRVAPVRERRAAYPSLSGKTVFITGGGSGIGAAMVEAFAQQGSRVAFVDVAEEASAALCERLQASGLQRPWWKVCDVSDVRALQAAVGEAIAELGDFEVLVNNVASDQRHTLEDVTPEYYEQRMAINERPALFAIQAVVPGMRRLGRGSIVNLGSTGWQGKAGEYPCYAIAKSSVNGLTRGLARPLGRDRIRINTVSPGWVMTERQMTKWLDAAGEEDIKRNQCLPDKLMPHDIAAMVLFLASDDAEMCTAQEFLIDAGWI
ncbi:SDR family NAD(P)-dependent oxidoreductase [Paraburkholderia adhaesiva]|uniref:SDR family NAD(P)-dependent oxidoreductase n=1 Tax=Paraburkholderia adhaesiva TaxID=2883244 RepID=UPI001F3A1BA7|nr:SDR family oxidoreductase [Paraburkholderia adhaesiva]